MTKGLVFWFTGLSGAGKTATARLAEPALIEAGIDTLVLDGDDLRAVISRDLGFDRESIRENNRRVASYCMDRRHAVDALLVPIISPYTEDRAMVRRMLEPGFFEVWVAADLKTVMARDPKGLYAKAQAGHIDNMIGYAETHPYEVPTSPDLTIGANAEAPDVSADRLVKFILAAR